MQYLGGNKKREEDRKDKLKIKDNIAESTQLKRDTRQHLSTPEYYSDLDTSIEIPEQIVYQEGDNVTIDETDPQNPIINVSIPKDGIFNADNESSVIAVSNAINSSNIKFTDPNYPDNFVQIVSDYDNPIPGSAASYASGVYVSEDNEGYQGFIGVTDNPEFGMFLGDEYVTTLGIYSQGNSYDVNIAGGSPKGILYAGDYSATFVDRSLVDKEYVDNQAANLYTGWAEYRDTTYTSGSPFSIVADTKVTLPNEADVVVNSQKPIDITTFYDEATYKITGRNGDGLNVLVEFIAVPQSVGATYIDTSIDIGGAVGEIYPRSHTFPKGVGIEKYISFSVGGYTLNTWESNGGLVKVVSDGPVNIYNIRYVLTRTHKAR